MIRIVPSLRVAAFHDFVLSKRSDAGNVGGVDGDLVLVGAGEGGGGGLGGGFGGALLDVVRIVLLVELPGVKNYPFKLCFEK